MIAAKPQSEREGSVYDYLRYLNKAQEQQELIRLFYVGVTRAKRSCTITATQKSEKAWPADQNTSFLVPLSCEASAGTTVHYEPIKISPETETSGVARRGKNLRRVKTVDVPSDAITPRLYLVGDKPCVGDSEI